MAALAGATLASNGILDWPKAGGVTLVIAAIAVSHYLYQRKNVTIYDQLKADREALWVALGLAVKGRFLPDEPLVENTRRGLKPAYGTPLFVRIVWILACALAILELLQAAKPAWQAHTPSTQVPRSTSPSVCNEDQLRCEKLNGHDGRDGAPGRDGRDGRDGLPGRDGRDAQPVGRNIQSAPSAAAPRECRCAEHTLK